MQPLATPETARLLQEGVACHRAGDFAGAERAYRKVLKKNPREPDALHLLGLILNQGGNAAAGAASIKTALAVRDDFPDAHLNLGLMLAHAGNMTEAEHHLRRAAHYLPAAAGIHINLGLLLVKTGRVAEAALSFETAIRVDPRNIEARVELIRIKRLANDPAEMLDAVTAALAIQPANPVLHVMAAEALFAQDRLREAWREYRFRFQSPENTTRAKTYPLPLWQGEPLAGRSILVWTEQAPGDEIMYANMLPDLIAAAGRCLVQCSPRLAPLFRRSFPAAEIYDRDLTAEALKGIDVQSPIGNIGEWLRPDIAAFPRHDGYLRPDTALRDRLRDKYTGGDRNKLVVGLSWRSAASVNGAVTVNAADKSLDILQWGPVLHVPSVVFVNLQYGPTDQERADVRTGFGVTVIQDDTIDSLKDMDSYAAQVAAMDMVVTSSNTAAHVAGALGVPTLCLLPESLAHGRRWYWFAPHDPCPWYPAMRLLVRKPGDPWLTVIRDAGVAVLDRAAARGVDPVGYLRAMAQAFVKMGRPDDAIALYYRLAQEPSHAAEAYSMSAELYLPKDPDRALAAAEQAIAADPKVWLGHNAKGLVLNVMRRFEDAAAAFQAGLAQVSSIELRANLGRALAMLGHRAEALRELGQAHAESRAAEPGMRRAIALNYGNALKEGGEPARAVEVFRDLVADAPDLVDAHYNLSLALLSLGQFEEGWRENAWRLKRPDMARYIFPPPKWAGDDLAGKKILIWTEQGIGDEIIVAGMAADAVAKAKRVVLLCSERMVPLLRRSFPQAIVDVRKEPLPKAAIASDIDVQMSLSDLGAAFRTSFADFPLRTSFLAADMARRDALRARYQARRPGAPLVGLSWSSRHNPELGWLKSIDLADLAPVLSVPGVTFVNLQYGDWSAALAAARAQTGVEILHDPDVDPLKDMDAFAAQVAAMDLVISVSNTTVHVAGGLGVPTWVMLPEGRGRMWYWFHHRTDSPWYSSVRLMTRGAERDDAGWRPVIAQCAADLKAWAETRD